MGLGWSSRVAAHEAELKELENRITDVDIVLYGLEYQLLNMRLNKEARAKGDPNISFDEEAMNWITKEILQLRCQKHQYQASKSRVRQLIFHKRFDPLQKKILESSEEVDYDQSDLDRLALDATSAMIYGSDVSSRAVAEVPSQVKEQKKEKKEKKEKKDKKERKASVAIPL